ncbi:MAG: hypothetical protein ACXVPD_05550, partial [Bacteroidia bacterium]
MATPSKKAKAGNRSVAAETLEIANAFSKAKKNGKQPKKMNGSHPEKLNGNGNGNGSSHAVSGAGKFVLGDISGSSLDVTELLNILLEVK